jgi:hypothetical protein
MSIRLHHVGIVVADLEAYLRQSLWQPDRPIVTDPIQQARLCLTKIGSGDATCVELVQPLDERSRLWGALQRGGGFHHLCMAVATEAAGDTLMRERRLLPVTPWQPAVLFGGRMVRFVYTRNRELLELFADEGAG